MNKCNWCGNQTENKEHYSAMSPLNEKYEKLIKKYDKKYGQFWYDNIDGKINEKLLNDVMIYDQATNTVGKGIVCNDCHEKDEIIYQKYRQLTATEDGDPYGMLKIVVGDYFDSSDMDRSEDGETDYDLDKMEEWHNDIKERQSNSSK